MQRVTIICLLLFTSACVNTPDGSRSALTFNKTSLLEADPAEFRAAYQTDMPPEHIPDDPGLRFILRDANDDAMIERYISMQRIAHGQQVGHDLPEALPGQSWTIWKPDATGTANMREIQTRYRAARENGESGSFHFNWHFANYTQPTVPIDVVYVTFALRLADDDPWFTLMDNLPVYPIEDATTE